VCSQNESYNYYPCLTIEFVGAIGSAAEATWQIQSGHDVGILAGD
jgi:hypothetical protein